MFIGFDSWPRATAHMLGGGSVGSSFGPYWPSRRSTSSASSPCSGSTASRAPTSAADRRVPRRLLAGARSDLGYSFSVLGLARRFVRSPRSAGTTWVPALPARCPRSGSGLRSRPASPVRLDEPDRGLDLRTHRPGRERSASQLARRDVLEQPLLRRAPIRRRRRRRRSAMTNRSASTSRASSSLARSLSITASTPTQRRARRPARHRRDAAAARADHDDALVQQPRIGRISKMRCGSGDGTTRRQTVAVLLEDPALLARPARPPRPRRRSGPTNLVGSPNAGSAGSTSTIVRSVASGTSTGRSVAAAPARSGSRSCPRSARPGRRADRARPPWYAAAWRASRPTCGPLPWDSTSSCSLGDGASDGGRLRMLRPLDLGGHRLAPLQQGVATERDDDSHVYPPEHAVLRPERRDQDRLDRVQPVLGLVEHDARPDSNTSSGHLEAGASRCAP